MKNSLIVSIAASIFYAKSLFAGSAPPVSVQTQMLDLQKVFSASPWIYALLMGMSVASLTIWLYSLATFRQKELMPKAFSHKVKALLTSSQYDQAQSFCTTDRNLLASIVAAGLSTRKLGPQVMIDAMKSEGKRASTRFWQRLSLLQDIVIVAPMFGLLGTVVGMFYAFYDVNRSVESINALFDGLGIAVGTTVAGLVVSILAMIFHTTLKYRLIKSLSVVENEAFSMSSLIDTERH